MERAASPCSSTSARAAAWSWARLNLAFGGMVLSLTTYSVRNTSPITYTVPQGESDDDSHDIPLRRRGLRRLADLAARRRSASGGAADPWRRRHPRHDARAVRAPLLGRRPRRAGLRLPASRRVGRPAASAHEPAPVFRGYRCRTGLRPHPPGARSVPRRAVG